jgi:type II secretory pathway component PulF
MSRSLAIAYNNLSTLLAAGVPLTRSLQTTSAGLPSALKSAFTTLNNAVANGNTLAEGMPARPDIFKPLDVAVVKAAENSGSLPESLALLAKWYEFHAGITRKLLSGILLPLAVFHIAAVVAPLPAFFLGDQNVGRLAAQIIATLAFFVYIPAAVIYTILNLTPKKGILRHILDAIALRIPVLGKALYKLSLSRYCWVFHMMTAAGVPITTCAETAAASSGNLVVANLFEGALQSARNGNPLSEGFSEKLPLEFINIWQVGEETGKLDDVTRRLAQSTGQDADFLFARFAEWLPRVVYAVVSALIIYAIFAGIQCIGRAYSI